ncbi:uncharacterized protein TRUGW13939_07135 [Talaromyces rugulosus]|uniref:Glutaredoxin domain-containing protein n=1 Tax=Talaromyces rugulosus TaxID=121627 RepID=A0A7H8R547_TALRU|nr:uncharacterized protein TRUGW13939_07135 [Talaromyces rugulosus]QKX59993.1 hypothetical protein TRUGW13939_07135 [Talaromyces rugulosus]
MFRLHKTLDVITLFHKPSQASSTRVLNILRTASANATETATIDQASDHSAAHTASPRGEFELEVTEEPPTNDQLSTILDYLQTKGVKPSAVIQGASTKQDALKKLKEVGDQGFIRPVVVDWSNGRAAVGENESEILKLVREGEASS